MTQQEEFLELTGAVDVVFKAIMYKHPKVFRKILELSLNKKIQKFTYLSPELPVRQFIEKGKSLDVYLVTHDSYVDVEVSCNYKESIKNRNLAYGYQMYCQTVQKGDDYEDYKKIELINFIFDKQGKKEILNSYLKDQYGGITSKMLLYSEIYIENFKKMYYNKDVENINKYKYYIMLDLTARELEEFNQKYGDDIVKEYKNALEEVSYIKEFLPLFSKEEDERRMRNTYRKWDRRAGLKEGRKEGLKKGRKEGLKEGLEEGFSKGIKESKTEIVKNMLNENIDMNMILKVTGLDEIELLKIKETM